MPGNLAGLVRGMLKGETIRSGASPYCPDCGRLLRLDVLHSNAGYYIGTRCCCGPYSRESGYYRTRGQAEAALKSGRFSR